MGQRIVAKVRVAVDHADVRHRPPPGVEQQFGDAIADSQGLSLETQEARALQPGHRQETLGRQGLDRLWNGDVGPVRKEVAIEPHDLGFAFVVELLAQPVADLVGHFRGVDRAVDPLEEADQSAKLGEVALHRALHFGILEFDREAPTVEGGRPVHLAQRRGMGGFEVEFRKPAEPVGAELGGHAAAHERAAHGGGVGLQLPEFGGEFGGQQVRHGGQHLRGLHQGPPKIAQRRLQRLGVALRRAVAADELAGRHLQPGACEPCADLRKALHAPAHAVAFRVLLRRIEVGRAHGLYMCPSPWRRQCAAQPSASNSSIRRSRRAHPAAQNDVWRGSRPKGASAST